MKPFQRILVATDFSNASRPAFDEAVRLAKASGAQLSVVHAYQVPAAALVSPAPADVYEDLERALRTDAEEKLQALIGEARREGVGARALLLAGFPDEEIIAAATRDKSDLIVLGTHGRRGAARFFLGSVASRLVATSPCPVMTVRSRAAAPAKSASKV